MKRTAATSNSSEKSPNKRQKKNQRPGDEATTSNVTAASTEAASSDQQVGLQQQINAIRDDRFIVEFVASSDVSELGSLVLGGASTRDSFEV